MAWIKVPPEHHPIFWAALPDDRRVTTMPLFGGVAAKVNGHIFAGLFARSVMLLLPEPLRAEALALDGASMFDPMGDGRARSDKVMLPDSMMDEPAELRGWIAKAFDAALELPRKPAKKPKPQKQAKAKQPAAKRSAAKKPAAKHRGAKKPAAKPGSARDRRIA